MREPSAIGRSAPAMPRDEPADRGRAHPDPRRHLALPQIRALDEHPHRLHHLRPIGPPTPRAEPGRGGRSGAAWVCTHALGIYAGYVTRQPILAAEGDIDLLRPGGPNAALARSHRLKQFSRCQRRK